MAEQHLDQYEHMNYDKEADKAMFSGHSGKQRSKKEAAQNTNHHNPGGHERKIVTKLQNAEKNTNIKDAKNGTK
jgi:nuclear protein 1